MKSTIAESEAHASVGLLEIHIVSFLEHLRAAGYAEHTRRKKRAVARAFARWMQSKQIALHELNESHIAAFVVRPPRKQKARVRFHQGVLSLLLKYLRQEGWVPRSSTSNDTSPMHGLVQAYVNYLRKDRGLAENSILVYTPFIRDLLLEQVARTGGACVEKLDAEILRHFLLEHVRDRSGEHARLLTTALRSFLRFLFLRGYLPTDLSSSVPTVRKHHQVAPPTFLSVEEVERVLTATDRSTPKGRRDYAILLLLARLALRAGEIATLELQDIHWRTGEIVVRGKGQIVECLPLLSDVGEALALYLRDDRGGSASRRVFERVWAPRIGLSGPAAVGHIVRQALARAGVHRSGRGAAHLFRHSLATRMIRHGACIAEIAQVLRHRSQTTTAIYAHVSFESLRSVARPWPVLGGEQ